MLSFGKRNRYVNRVLFIWLGIFLVVLFGFLRMWITIESGYAENRDCCYFEALENVS